MTGKTRLYADFAPRMRYLAVFMGVFVAISTPLTYFVLQLREERLAADRLSQEIAEKVVPTIRTNPELWKYSVVKFMKVFDEMEGREIAQVRIIDESGELLDSEDFGRRSILRTRGVADLFYNNAVYGRVEVDKVSNTTLYSSLLLFMMSCAFGVGAAFLLFKFPAGFIKKAELKIDSTLERLKEEIEERKRKEEALATSVREKEILLKEIHHRVKNNLQLIASLLNLRMNRMERGESWDLLQNIKYKVYSMANAHELLYRNDSLTKIEMGSYLDTLIGDDGIGAGEAAIDYLVDADDIRLPLDRAMPIGLIVSELVMNARKYAFRGRERGRVDIVLRKRKNGTLDLTVSDDGVGLPSERQESGSSLGYLLVKALSAQIGGKLSTESGNGLTVCVENIEYVE